MTISYGVSHLNIRPVPQSFECEFSLDDAGFVFGPPLGSQPVCDGPPKEEIAAKERLGWLKPDEFEKAQDCQNKNTAYRSEFRQRESLAAPYKDIGIYPIDPATTELNP